MKDQSNARGKSLLVKPNTSSFYYVFQYRRRRTGGKHTAVFLLHVSGWHASTNVFINNKKNNCTEVLPSSIIIWPWPRMSASFHVSLLLNWTVALCNSIFS